MFKEKGISTIMSFLPQHRPFEKLYLHWHSIPEVGLSTEEKD